MTGQDPTKLWRGIKSSTYPDFPRGLPSTRYSTSSEVGTGPLTFRLKAHRLLAILQFEWDPDKQRVNLRKHGVFLADAVATFHDPHAVTVEDLGHHEQHFVTVGMDAFGRVLLVGYAYRKTDTIRIIFARNADPSERKQYGS